MRNVRISAAAPSAKPVRARKPGKAVAVIASTATEAPATDAPAATAEPIAKPAFIPGFLAKRDATINVAAYPFQITSNRDSAYLTFYAYAAAATDAAGFTLGDLYDISAKLTGNTAAKRRNPFAGPSIASAPATDAGAAERAIKRGVLRIADINTTGHNVYALTDAGRADAAAAIGAAAFAEYASNT